MPNAYLLEDTIRTLDSAVYNWIGLFKVNYGTIAGVDRTNCPILRTFASPHRAFAQVADLLVAQNWIAGDNPALQRARATIEWPVLPLPIATIERDDPIIDNSLANPAAVWRRAHADANGNFISHQYPLHYLTQYRVTFWSEKRYTHAAFMEWILSQLGLRGSLQSEILLPIEHPEPWGVQYHQLRYIGSADLSDLEGNDARHIRSMLSFTLRSWAFRAPDPATSPVFATREDYHVDTVDPEKGHFEAFPDDGVWGTNNLFTLNDWTPAKVATTWSRTGFATVSLVTTATGEQAVHAELTQPDDAVAISAFPTTPDSFGRTVWGLAAKFDATVPFTIQVTAPQPDGSERLLTQVSVPAGVTDFHKFFVADDTWVAFSIVFDAAAGGVTMSNVDIRQVWEKARIPYSGVVAGATLDFTWAGLEKRPYLVLGVLTADATGAGDVTLADDATTPEGTKTDAIDTAESIGFAMLTMPKESTIKLSAPSGFRFSVLHAQVFDGPWRGSSI